MSTFGRCSSLTSITLPSSITDIDFCAFLEGEKLESIKAPSGKAEFFKNLLDDEYLAKLVVEIDY